MRLAYFFDLDSTVCDTRHRWAIINQKDKHKTDWKAYSMACSDDSPIPGVAALIRSLAKLGAEIYYVSGRHGAALEITKLWLKKHELPYNDVFLRPLDDSNSKNGALKAGIILEWRLRNQDAEIVVLVDDWPDVIPFLAEIDVPTLLVKPPFEEESILETERSYHK